MPKLSRAALDERRGHILRAAERCFARNGFRATTIADIKREAGVSTGAIYTYFPNKEAMIRAILQSARDERTRQLVLAMQPHDGTAAQAAVLLAWTRSIFGAEGQHGARLNLNLWAEALRNPRVGKLARGALDEARRAVSAVVAARLEAAGTKVALDPEAVAALLVAIFLGLETQSAVGAELVPAELDRALVAFFGPYLPDAEASARTTARRAKAGREKARPQKARKPR